MGRTRHPDSRGRHWRRDGRLRRRRCGAYQAAAICQCRAASRVRPQTSGGTQDPQHERDIVSRAPARCAGFRRHRGISVWSRHPDRRWRACSDIRAEELRQGCFRCSACDLLAGRLPANEDTLGAQRVALIGERLWTSRFARSANVIGRSIAIDDESHIIVGVLPSKGAFPEQRADVWRVIVPDASGGIAGRVQAIAALRGVMPAALLDERLRAVSRRLHQQDALALDQQLSSDELIQQRWGRPYTALRSTRCSPQLRCVLARRMRECH